MSFVWRSGTTADANREPLSPHDARIPRIIISVVFALGIIYFVLITRTLRRYGEVMDRAWKSRIMEWVHEKVTQVEDTLRHHSRSPSPSRTFRNQQVVSSRHSTNSLESGIDITIMPPSRPASVSSSSTSSQQQHSFIKEFDMPPKSVHQPALFSSPHPISHIISADNQSDSTTTAHDYITEKSLQAAPQIKATKLFNVSPDSASITPLAEEILASCLLDKGNSEELALVSEIFPFFDNNFLVLVKQIYNFCSLGRTLRIELEQ